MAPFQNILEAPIKRHNSPNLVVPARLESFSREGRTAPAPGMRRWAEIVPRVNFPGAGTPDVKYSHRLHGKSAAFDSPEEAAGRLRRFLR